MECVWGDRRINESGCEAVTSACCARFGGRRRNTEGGRETDLWRLLHNSVERPVVVELVTAREGGAESAGAIVAWGGAGGVGELVIRGPARGRWRVAGVGAG